MGLIVWTLSEHRARVPLVFIVDINWGCNWCGCLNIRRWWGSCGVHQHLVIVRHRSFWRSLSWTNLRMTGGLDGIQVTSLAGWKLSSDRHANKIFKMKYLEYNYLLLEMSADIDSNSNLWLCLFISYQKNDTSILLNIFFLSVRKARDPSCSCLELKWMLPTSPYFCGPP